MCVFFVDLIIGAVDLDLKGGCWPGDDLSFLVNKSASRGWAGHLSIHLSHHYLIILLFWVRYILSFPKCNYAMIFGSCRYFFAWKFDFRRCLSSIRSVD